MMVMWLVCFGVSLTLAMTSPICAREMLEGVGEEDTSVLQLHTLGAKVYRGQSLCAALCAGDDACTNQCNSCSDKLSMVSQRICWDCYSELTMSSTNSDEADPITIAISTPRFAPEVVAISTSMMESNEVERMNHRSNLTVAGLSTCEPSSICSCLCYAVNCWEFWQAKVCQMKCSHDFDGVKNALKAQGKIGAP